VEPGKTYTLRVKAYDRKRYGGDRPSIPVGFDFNEGVPQAWIERFSGHTKFAYGLTGHVRLVVVPSVYVSDVFVQTSVATKSFSCDIWISNGSPGDRSLDVEGSFAPWNASDWDYPAIEAKRVTVPAGKTVKVSLVDVPWDLGPESYWWPNIPFSEDYRATLHWLNIALVEKGATRDERKQRFGFVQYAEGPYCYTVNGVRFNSFGDSLSYGQVGEFDCWTETPCFQPPREGVLGCPETWRRYQRIGFNSVRLSTSVPTRYMLQSADEAGYMLIPEGGSWGNGTCKFHQERFTGQLQDMIRVCRNHPSVARYSMANESLGPNMGSPVCRAEPGVPDDQPGCVWRQLIDAAWEADPTRPYVFEHSNWDHDSYRVIRGLENGHASRMQHYRPIVPRTTSGIRGQGEVIWTTRGMRQFAAAARSLRFCDYAHFAPWSWVNYWPNFLEGMSHERHPWRINNHPDREDGIDGWGSPLVTEVRRSLHPYLILDHQPPIAESGYTGHDTPGDAAEYMPGQRVERRVEVFNGGLFGDKMQLRWSTRWDTPEGPVVEPGETVGPFTIEPGFHATRTIAFTAPALRPAETDRKLYLVLESIKGGKIVFREDTTWLTISRQPWFMVDDGHSAVSYAPAWTPYQGNPCFKGTEHYSQEMGATATFTFTGTRARYYGCRRNDLGIVEVAVDGKVKGTVDLYQPSRQYTKLYETDELPPGEHTLRVKVTGEKHADSKGRYVIVDAFGFASTDQEKDRP